MDYFKKNVRPDDTWVYADEADNQIAELEAKLEDCASINDKFMLVTEAQHSKIADLEALTKSKYMFMGEIHKHDAQVIREAISFCDEFEEIDFRTDMINYADNKDNQ